MTTTEELTELFQSIRLTNQTVMQDLDTVQQFLSRWQRLLSGPLIDEALAACDRIRSTVDRQTSVSEIGLDLIAASQADGPDWLDEWPR